MSKITDYRIVLSQTPKVSELRAACFLREKIKLVCGKKLPLVSDTEPPEPLEIVVGETGREALDGVEIARTRDGVWEYVMLKKGERLYLLGLGAPPAAEPPYNTAYRKLDDGATGTVMAAYHFVEDILHYQFVYADLEEFPESPDLEMPKEYEYRFTRAALEAQRPKPIKGAALYSLNTVARLEWNVGSFIIKTRAGKLIVIDGGHMGDLPRLVECLKSISGEEVPTVTAWLFSHLHDDHHGAYLRLVRDGEWRGKVIVKDVYHHFLPREFYTDISKEASAHFGPEHDAIMSSDKTFGATLHTVRTGERISVDEIDFDVLHVPDISFGKQMNVNDTSVVYKMTYDKGQTMMFLGDAEWIGSNDLVENHANELKSDVVQVGHHGCGSCSDECYRLIGAKAYIWQCGERFWYQDCSEGLNTHNVGLIRYRTMMKRFGIKDENVYVTLGDIDSLPLPIPIH